MPRNFIDVPTKRIVSLFLRANRAFLNALETGKSIKELTELRRDVHDFGEEIKIRSDMDKGKLSHS